MVLASPSWNKTSDITVPFTVYSILIKLLQLYMKDIFGFMKRGITKLFLMICQTNWDKINSNDVDKYAQDLTNQHIKLAKKHIPNKLIKSRQTDPPCNNIKKLLRKRKCLYDKYKRTNSIHDYESYKQTRNKVTAAIRKAKALETEKLTQKLRYDNIKSENWWKTFKNVIKRGLTSSIPPLCKDDVIYSDPKLN